ncbi:hypothetical protein, partial [Nocardia farcinica]|uniref:hypothetical protein n=1 Tax=Nocardia farcinica TaxID=37329 RepID=UPI00245805DC
ANFGPFFWHAHSARVFVGILSRAATSLAESSRLRAPRFRGQSTTTEDVDDDVPLLAQQRGRTAHQSLLGGQHDPTNSATDRLHRFGA